MEKTFTNNETGNLSFNVRLFIVVFSLVFISPFIFNYIYPNLAPFYFFAADSFYYFDLTKNSQNLNFFSFDHVYPTNGFHPIWEFLLFYLEKIKYLDITKSSEFITKVFNLDLFIISTASGIFSIFCSKYIKPRWLTLLVFAPGLIWYLEALSASDYLSTWSYVNGMETAISLLFFSLSLLFYLNSEKRPFLQFFSILFMGLSVLSRLDEIFLFFSFFLFLMYSAKGSRRIYSLISFVPPVLLILYYLIYNKLTVGIFMPISGWEKSGFALFENIKAVARLVLPYLSWDKPSLLNTSLVGYSIYSECYMRIVQIFVPMIVCFVYMFNSYKKNKLKSFGIIEAICLGIILKGTYNFLFVSVWRQGSWYFGSSIFIANFLLTIILSKWLRCFLNSYKVNYLYIKNSYLIVVCIVISQISFNIFLNHKLSGKTGSGYNIYYNRSELVDFMKKSGQSKFIEMEDGIISFSANVPSIGGLGPILDPKASLARKNGAFFSLVYNRGYRILIASDDYSVYMNNYLNNKLWLDKKTSLWGIKPSEFNQFNINLIKHDEKSHLSYYRLIKSNNSNS